MSTATAIKERPILFSGPMVRAILDGRKTQTRRVIKEQPTNSTCFAWFSPDGIDKGNCAPSGLWTDTPKEFVQASPYGGPGDRLWVRETWGMAATACGGGWCHAASVDPHASLGARRPSTRLTIPTTATRSRITLEITDVRVQRLQDISRDDAIAEGIDSADYLSPVAGFIDLWHTIHAANGPNGWEANPWVWALTFKRIPQCSST